MALRCKWYHIWFHISCLLHALHGVRCLFQGGDVGTLCNTQWVCHSGSHGSPLGLKGLCYPGLCMKIGTQMD